MVDFTIHHHGAVTGVTGSCHELNLGDGFSVLVDCGLFQGAETSGRERPDQTLGDIPVADIKALIVTHVHIDHVGRVPHLLAAGFKGPVLCSLPSAKLLPLVLEDAVKVGFTRDRQLIKQFLGQLEKQLIGLSYGHWFDLLDEPERGLRVRLQRAGHILGSAYVECEVRGNKGSGSVAAGSSNQAALNPTPEIIVFSGDLGAPHAPILPEPESPEAADVLVLESTYGNRLHEDRATRKARLKAVIQRAVRDEGVVLVPAFSIGRTQELIYELEAIIAEDKSLADRVRGTTVADKPLNWQNFGIIVDSPLASRFTETYRELKPYWDEEARETLKQGRDPLDFDQLITVDSHDDHLRMVRHLKKTSRACVVIAASGMCAGGRIVNYLKALIDEPKTDVLFVGYQAEGTPGREILEKGLNRQSEGSGSVAAGSSNQSTLNPTPVILDGERYALRAGVHLISGYSAHADQHDLVSFVKGISRKPGEVRLVHGSEAAKQTLAEKLKDVAPEAKVWVPKG